MIELLVKKDTDTSQWGGGYKIKSRCRKTHINCIFKSMQSCESLAPFIIKNSGNGSNFVIGDIKIQSIGLNALTIMSYPFEYGAENSTYFQIPYGFISSLKIDEVNHLIILNDRVAIKFTPPLTKIAPTV
jgi:hypothetical protein